VKKHQPWKGAALRRRIHGNEFIEAKVVPGKGRGIFAKRAFAPDELVCTFTGRVVPRKEDVPEALHDYIICNTGGQLIVPAPEVLGGHLANHSCRPNVALDKATLDTVLLRAIRPIAEGDEVTTYYGWTGLQNPPCFCGERHCAGVIGFRWTYDANGGGKVRVEDGADALRVAALNRNEGITTSVTNFFTTSAHGTQQDKQQRLRDWIDFASKQMPAADAAWLEGLLVRKGLFVQK
jgi:hypothetical protein